MTEITQRDHQADPIQPKEAARITTCWQGLPKSPIATDEQCREIQAGLAIVSTPARSSWIMVRVAAMMLQYYAPAAPPAATSIIAEDWLEALREYPEWAITNAVRWWKSADNPSRKNRPLEGDIAAMCEREIGVLRYARFAVKQYQGGYRQVSGKEASRPEPTPEQKARVNAMVAGLGSSTRIRRGA